MRRIRVGSDRDRFRLLATGVHVQGAASRGCRRGLARASRRSSAATAPEAQLSLRAPRAAVVTRPPPRLIRSDVLRLAPSTHLSVLAHSDLYARSYVHRAVSLENN